MIMMMLDADWTESNVRFEHYTPSSHVSSANVNANIHACIYFMLKLCSTEFDIDVIIVKGYSLNLI